MGINGTTKQVKIAIIGGTGFEDENIFDKEYELDIDTPFGKPSDKLICGKINGIDVVFLSRHSRTHSVMPSNIKTNACGSLDENYRKGDLVVCDQLYDHTRFRLSTFYDGTTEEFPNVHHSACPDPFDSKIRKHIINCLDGSGIRYHPNGTIAVIEGPRFSTRFESRFFKSIGCHIIGMTSSPEAFLAFEMGIPYATIALVTDMDSWDETVEHVNAESVTHVFSQFVGNLKILLVKLVESIASHD